MLRHCTQKQLDDLRNGDEGAEWLGEAECIVVVLKNVQELMLVLFFLEERKEDDKENKCEDEMGSGKENKDRYIAWGYAVVYRK